MSGFSPAEFTIAKEVSNISLSNPGLRTEKIPLGLLDYLFGSNKENDSAKTRRIKGIKLSCFFQSVKWCGFTTRKIDFSI